MIQNIYKFRFDRQCFVKMKKCSLKHLHRLDRDGQGPVSLCNNKTFSPFALTPVAVNSLSREK